MRIFKTIEKTYEHPEGLCKATRYRNSSGMARIILSVRYRKEGNWKEILNACNGNDIGDYYEMICKDLAETLDTIANEPCLLDRAK